MKNSRFYIAIIVGISVCILFTLLFRNFLIPLILGIFTALKITDPEKRKTGALLGAIIGTCSSILVIQKSILSIYDPEIHTVFVLFFSILFALMISGTLGAGLGAIQFIIFQHIKIGKVTL